MREMPTKVDTRGGGGEVAAPQEVIDVRNPGGWRVTCYHRAL